MRVRDHWATECSRYEWTVHRIPILQTIWWMLATLQDVDCDDTVVFARDQAMATDDPGCGNAGWERFWLRTPQQKLNKMYTYPVLLQCCPLCCNRLNGVSCFYRILRTIPRFFCSFSSLFLRSVRRRDIWRHLYVYNVLHQRREWGLIKAWQKVENYEKEISPVPYVGVVHIIRIKCREMSRRHFNATRPIHRTYQSRDGALTNKSWKLLEKACSCSTYYT
jgi:hypothetical protein